MNRDEAFKLFKDSLEKSDDLVLPDTEDKGFELGYALGQLLGAAMKANEPRDVFVAFNELQDNMKISVSDVDEFSDEEKG